MYRFLVLVLSVILVSACQTTSQVNCVSDFKTRVAANGHCLAVGVYGESSDANTLVVMVHGDTHGNQWAGTATLWGAKGVITVALVRPGYCGPNGCSSGSKPDYKGSYSSRIVDTVAEGVKALSAHYKAKRVIVVGRSGGSAILGAAIGRHAPLADAALLTACPCDVVRWKGGRWSGSLSPSSYTDDVPKTMKVIAITGSHDTYLSPDLAKDYIADLVKEGVTNSRFILVNAGHGVDHTQEFNDALTELLKARSAGS